jgi:hypothetical protein
MTRTFARFALLLVMSLALLSPGKSFAGPPEKISGKMVFDEVADGLRRYLMEKDEDKRAKWLEKLAPSRDPRVMVVIGEALFDESSWVIREAVRIVEEYYDPSIQLRSHSHRHYARLWWQGHEADMRRRAEQIQQ